MSALARLNMNKIPYFSWKGQTLEQITSVNKKNTNKFDDPTKQISVHDIRKAMPLKIYRKEIANVVNPSCSRNSSTIAAFEQPGGSIVNSNIKVNTGLANVLSNKPDTVVSQTTISSEHPGQCASPSSCFLSPEINAKKRVRSGGMYPKKFKVDYGNDKAYFTSSKEYLVSRNRTIQQNTYAYFRQGVSGVQPNTGNAKSNVYTPAGLSHCYQPIISATNNNNYFTYVWVDELRYTVTIPDGRYTVESLNTVFKNAMIANRHYFYDSADIKYFLLTIDFNNFNNQVILEANPATKLFPFNPSTYTPACGFDVGTWYDQMPTGSSSNIGNDYNITAIGIPIDNTFGLIVGFQAGDYYYSTGNGTYTAYSSFRPQIASNYVALYFKPSNMTFGVQGSVDSSTHIDRVKYNTVTRNGYLTKSAFGTATANAMAYGVSEQPYTIKDKIGFKNTVTPIIKKDGTVCCDPKFIYRMK